jgi:glycosyltransferase involved in cell wall biosynthesis
MRRLLVVSYMFPPVAGVGIERTLKHVTYLPKHGWQPVVVAAANPGYRLVDPATLDRVPAGTEVHRAPSLEPAHLRRAAGRLLRPGRRPSAARSLETPGSAGQRRGSRMGLVNAAWRAYVELAWFPDEQLGWVPAALATGLAADDANPVDAIYSSGPPWSSHLVAAAIHGLTGLPWVADFRDPWVGNAYASPLPRPHRAARAWLERAIVERARASVFASAGVRHEYARRYPGQAGSFLTIHNGYDLEDVAAIRERPRGGGATDGRFRIAFTGSIQGIAEARLLVAGLERLLERRPDLRDRLRVQLIGWLSPAAEAIAGARLTALAPTVERIGQAPKAVALQAVADADAALVLLADQQGREHVPSAKLFDYLGLDAPVLAVAPDGEVRRILAELDWGVLAEPTPEGFASGVERLIEAPPPDRPADPERRFERRALTARLASLLDGVAVR